MKPAIFFTVVSIFATTAPALANDPGMAIGTAADATCATPLIDQAKQEFSSKFPDVPGLSEIGIALCDPRDLKKAGGFQLSLPMHSPMARECGVALLFQNDKSMKTFAASYLTSSDQMAGVILCPKVKTTKADCEL